MTREVRCEDEAVLVWIGIAASPPSGPKTLLYLAPSPIKDPMQNTNIDTNTHRNTDTKIRIEIHIHKQIDTGTNTHRIKRNKVTI